jgi:hypothetical protein
MHDDPEEDLSLALYRHTLKRTAALRGVPGRFRLRSPSVVIPAIVGVALVCIGGWSEVLTSNQPGSVR